MKPEKEFTLELQTSLAWTAALTALFIVFNLKPEFLKGTFVALPFFILFYFFLFSAGKEKVVAQVRTWLNSEIKKIVVFPALLLFLHYAYVLILGKNPFEGSISMLPYLVYFPVLAFAARRNTQKEIDWLDFVTFILFLLPVTLMNSDPSGEMPEKGISFDSTFRILIMLTAVYAFAVVRGIDNVGFFPEFKLKSLGTAIWVWLAFYSFVFVIGYSVDFVQIKGYDLPFTDLILKITLGLLKIFLHTALFEELFFRGLLQNMLAKRMGQSKSWMTFWKWGLAILIPMALLVGYTLKGSMQWFPALITLAIFGAAYFIEKSGKSGVGVYTSLAITGVIFGLVHYHSNSIIYIGFACVAGWAYGYTWIITKNVFYAALVHALVNSSVLIFGLELVK